MKPDINATIEKLCNASVRDYINPYELMQWPQEISKEQWFFSPELISIYGTDSYNQLNEQQRQLVSFFEAVNFFSLNIHGERSLIEGLARRLYRKDNHVLAPYLHHFLDEENKHMIYFGGFCTKYAGKTYLERKLPLQPRHYEPGEEDFLFFAKVLIFEEIVDVYNIKMSTDERLNQLARQINLLHHKDEARHLVFGRQIVSELFGEYSPKWSDKTRLQVREYLANYLKATWSEYYNPDVYRDAGLPEPYDVRDEAMQSASAQEHRRKISEGCIKFFHSCGILETAPAI
jgi:hypothetical protein